MKDTKKKHLWLWCCISAIVLLAIGVLGGAFLFPHETIKYVEVQSTDKPMYDTTALEVWEGYTEDEGSIRMIGAWYYGVKKDGAVIVEDESGTLWTVEDLPIEETDFLLLWIADNSTDDDTTDDTIVKVWSEVHNHNATTTNSED